MGDIADHPVPRPGPIDDKAATEILEDLLAIERVRLAQAVEMEKTRRIVFPETTVIIKDIERLVSILRGRPVATGASGLDWGGLAKSMMENDG
jgi:hypothetical protein